MLRLQSAVISLLFPLVIAGCAASTPIPEPAPTALVPTMRPTAVPTAIPGPSATPTRTPRPTATPIDYDYWLATPTAPTLHTCADLTSEVEGMTFSNEREILAIVPDEPDLSIQRWKAGNDGWAFRCVGRAVMSRGGDIDLCYAIHRVGDQFFAEAALAGYAEASGEGMCGDPQTPQTPTPTPVSIPSQPTPAATPTPTPIPLTPTPTPNPAEYNIGLAYAEGQNLEQGDTETYATAFAQAKGIGLDNSAARTYADGLIFHTAYAAEEAAQEVARDYAAAFEQALIDDPSMPLHNAIGHVTETIRREYRLWPFDGDDSLSGVSFAETYTDGLNMATSSNLAAHGYALSYAGYLYTGNTHAESANRANAFALGYELASSTERCSSWICPDLQDRLAYATAYEDGRITASIRVDQGYTSERNIDAWAGAYAEAYVASDVQAGSCGFPIYGVFEGYNLNFALYTRRYDADAIVNQWVNSADAASKCAQLFAYGKIDVGGKRGFEDDYPYKQAEAYYRGNYYASELGFSGSEAETYAYAYYLAYFERREGWPEHRAHAYSVAYADARRMDMADDEAKAYASAYEEAYTSQRRNGASDEDAHAYAAAFAEARSGS